MPVLLSAAGWDPSEPFGTWAARRIRQDYPSVAAVCDPARLVGDHRVLPVLDGLDEMPRDLRGQALRDLDRAVGTGLPLVLTCRAAEFVQVVGDVGVLSDAAVLEVEPVRARDAATFLIQRDSRTTAARWKPVIDALDEPASPVAAALSTPLMVSLARQAYRAPGTTPRELTDLPTGEEVKRHLIEEFLSTVYPDPRRRAWSERRLAFLAHHLHDRVRDANLHWWRLAEAVPRPVITCLVATAVTGLGVLVGLLALVLFGPVGGPLPLFVICLLTGVFTGTICGVNAGRVAHHRRTPAPASLPQVVLATLRDLVTGLAAGGVAGALLLVGTRLVSPANGLSEASWLLHTVTPGNGDILAKIGPALLILTLGLCLAAVCAGMGAQRAGVPHRSTPRPRTLPRDLLRGYATGLLLSLPWTAVSFGTETPWWSGPVIAGIFATLIGVPLGLGRWLGTPTGDEGAVSPLTTLRADRVSLLVTVAGTTAVSALGIMLIPWLGADASGVATLFIGIGGGSAIAVVVLFGTGAPWPSYTVARLWLALAGRLPWRLGRFLREAHDAEVLRQAGPAYQFRHDLLAAHLAARYRPAPRWIASRVHGPGRRRDRLPRAALSTPLALVLAGPLILGVAEIVVRESPQPAPVEVGDGDITIGPDGRTVAVTDSKHGTRLFDARTGRQVGVIRPPSPSPFFSPDGRILASTGCLWSEKGAACGTATLWNATTGRRIAALTRPGIALFSLGFSPDGAILATIDCHLVRRPTATGPPRWGACGSVRLWRAATGRLLATLRTSHHVVERLVFAPDSSRLAISGADMPTELWDVAKGQRIGLLSTGVPRREAFSPDGRILATVEMDAQPGTGTVRVWDATSTGRPIHSLPLRINNSSAFWMYSQTDPDFLWPMFSPDGRFLAARDLYGPVVLDLVTGRALRPPTPAASSDEPLVFRDRFTLTVLGPRGVYRWNVGSGAIAGPRDLGIHGSITRSAISADGRTAAVTYNGVLSVWDLTDGRRLLTALDASGETFGMRLGPTGAYLARSQRGRLFVWYLRHRR